MNFVDLPSPTDAIAGGRALELMSVEALVGIKPAPLRPRAGGQRRTHLVFLVPPTALRGPSRTLIEQVNQLVDDGIEVTVISHYGLPESAALLAAHRQVPFGEPIEDAIPACDLIVAAHWEFILPARKLAIAPVVHLEYGDFHLIDVLPQRIERLISASLTGALVTISFANGVTSSLRLRFGVTAHELTDDRELPATLLGYAESFKTDRQSRSLGRFELSLEGMRFHDAGDERLLRRRLETCSSAAVALPVSQPAWRDHRVVRWRVVGGRSRGTSDVTRLYLPTYSDEPLSDSPWQVGIDLLRGGRGDEAASYFLQACKDHPLSEQVVIGRWLVLALLEAGRSRDAAELAVAFARDFPGYPDYLYLAVVSSRAAGDLFDIAGPVEGIRLLGHGARYEEWFEAPAQLLSQGLVAA